MVIIAPIVRSSTISVKLAEQRNSHLETTVEDLKTRLDAMKAERDQAMQDARADRARVVAFLEYQRPEFLWSKLFR